MVHGSVPSRPLRCRGRARLARSVLGHRPHAVEDGSCTAALPVPDVAREVCEVHGVRSRPLEGCEGMGAQAPRECALALARPKRGDLGYRLRDAARSSEPPGIHADAGVDAEPHPHVHSQRGARVTRPRHAAATARNWAHRSRPRQRGFTPSRQRVGRNWPSIPRLWASGENLAAHLGVALGCNVLQVYRLLQCVHARRWSFPAASRTGVAHLGCSNLQQLVLNLFEP
mmetsp:Transcript_55643/g.180615  ORF Transcript_55643/g.180615 Transcript_55643/m.180615 type:complete len:228 (-) Transcript_55643:203-886(-)